LGCAGLTEYRLRERHLRRGDGNARSGLTNADQWHLSGGDAQRGGTDDERGRELARR